MAACRRPPHTAKKGNGKPRSAEWQPSATQCTQPRRTLQNPDVHIYIDIYIYTYIFFFYSYSQKHSNHNCFFQYSYIATLNIIKNHIVFGIFSFQDPPRTPRGPLRRPSGPQGGPREALWGPWGLPGPPLETSFFTFSGGEFVDGIS